MPTRIISTQRQLPCVPDVRRLKGPCPDGFHVPRITEDINYLLESIFPAFTNKITSMERYKYVLLMPYTGHERYQGFFQVGTNGYRWTSNPRLSEQGKSICVSFNDNSRSQTRPGRVSAMPIRPFKDTPVEPDDTWQVLHDGGNGGIYWNPSLGLITAKATNQYGTLIVTLADKNLGATTAWTDSSQALTTEVTGYYYQWGNNYGFPGPEQALPERHTEQVDTTGYSWKNPYSSDKFITNGTTGMTDWSNPSNDDLWGGLSWNCMG